MAEIGSVLWHVQQAENHLYRAEEEMGDPDCNPDHSLRAADLHLRLADARRRMLSLTVGQLTGA